MTAVLRSNFAVALFFVSAGFVIALGEEHTPVLQKRPGFRLEQLPSTLWPVFVQLQDSHRLASKLRFRGSLIRVEGDRLLVDFGRHGLMQVDPHETDFFEQVMAGMKRPDAKEFPNLALQIGNKLMRFDRGNRSGAIRFEEVRGKSLYILLYLDQYSPDQAEALLDFGAAYSDLEDRHPALVLVLMPNDRTYYDFGASSRYAVPMIIPHMRKGYIDGLAHQVETYPTFVACDANGRILERSAPNLRVDNLADALRSVVQRIGMCHVPSVSDVEKNFTFNKETTKHVNTDDACFCCRHHHSF